jgi:hypothetical protein
MVERDSLPCLLERQAGSSVGRREVILLSIGTLVGMPLQSAHAAAATAEGTDVRSAFGKGITSSTSAWPFDQIKGKRARDAEAAASAASAEVDAADGVGEEGQGEDSGAVGQGEDSSAVPMKKAKKSPPPKPVELVEYADTGAGFSLLIPKDYFKSSRGRACASNDRACQASRGKDLGTLFVSGNLQSAQIVSVQRLSIEQLLAAVGVLPTGDLTSWPAIGKPQKVP